MTAPTIEAPVAASRPELSEALTITVGLGEVRATERANFRELDEAAQETYVDGHPAYFNRVVEGTKGVYMGSTASDNHRWADSLATGIGTATMAERMDSAPINGATDDEALKLMHEAAEAADKALADAKVAKLAANPDSTWVDADASLSGVRLFRNKEGDQKAVLFSAGSNRILRLRGDGAEELVRHQEGMDGLPLNTFTGEGRPAETALITDQVKVIDVKPGDRFVLVERGLKDWEGRDVNSDSISAVARKTVNQEPKEAAQDLSKISDYKEDDSAGYVADYGDITTAVMDVEAERDWTRLQKLGLPFTRAFVWAQLRREDRVARNREAFLENSTWKRRLLVAADSGVLLVGAYFATKVVGAGMGLTHGGGGNPDTAHHVMNTLAPSPSVSHSPVIEASSTPSGTATPPVTGGHPPGGANNPNNLPGAIPSGNIDSNHLPAGVKLTDEQVAWLNNSHSEGEIGAYDSNTPNDGLGHDGTVWRSAMQGLKDAGYDPSKLSTNEKTAYVQHVFDLNGKMSLDDATKLQDGFVPKQPTNLDMIKTVTDITDKHEGGPLLPSADSDAGKHIADIKHTVETQVSGGAGDHHRTDGDADNSGRIGTDSNSNPVGHPNPGATPTDVPVSPSASASKSAAAPVVVPTIAGTPTSGAEGNHDGGTNPLVVAGIVGAGLAAAGGTAIAVNRFRNRGAGEATESADGTTTDEDEEETTPPVRPATPPKTS
jgi:hypothetical protein